MQVIFGHEQGLNTYEYQHTKVLAMEGHFESYDNGVPLILFGIPDQEAGEMRYALSIPKIGGPILGKGWNAQMDGLDTVPRQEQPPVGIVFWSFRVMVGIGLAMVGIGMWSLWARYKGRLYDDRWLHRASLAMGPSGLVAVIAGWITTEVGRQPYTVYGELLTVNSTSPLDASAVGASLIAFIVIYFLVFGAGVGYLIKLMLKTPERAHYEDDIDYGPIRSAGLVPGVQQPAPQGSASNQPAE